MREALLRGKIPLVSSKGDKSRTEGDRGEGDRGEGDREETAALKETLRVWLQLKKETKRIKDRINAAEGRGAPWACGFSEQQLQQLAAVHSRKQQLTAAVAAAAAGVAVKNSCNTGNSRTGRLIRNDVRQR